MSTILIVGDGPLASEVAELAARSGHTVLPYLFNQRGPDLAPLATLSTYVHEIANTIDLTVEAVISSRMLKELTLSQLSNAFVGTDEPILTAALNASASEVAQWTVHPANVVGFAGLPPLGDAETVEVMAGLKTDPAMLAKAQEFIMSLGKEPVLVGDTVGGILPRIVANLINEAAYALMEGVASAEDIDQAMKLGTNYPHGPLEWGDLIGLDQVVGIIDAIGESAGADRYRAAPMLQRFVHAGMWGQRTGQGFYQH
jgi:3-hydroxybutyryl-CoA dehydrogenase